MENHEEVTYTFYKHTVTLQLLFLISMNVVKESYTIREIQCDIHNKQFESPKKTV